MNTVVIFRSKTGFTKKYAKWIAQSLHADLFDIKKIKLSMLNNYDTIIFGSSIYAGGILGAKFITNNLDSLNSKNIIIYATGVSPIKDEIIQDVVKHNFSSELLKYIKFYYLRGGFDYNNLSWFNKMLIKALKSNLIKKQKNNYELTEKEKDMLSVFEQPYLDFTDQKQIDPIINDIKSK